MNHPLTRIITPISMVVLVAAITVAAAIVDTNERLPVGEVTVATAAAEADQLPTITISQSAAERRN